MSMSADHLWMMRTGQFRQRSIRSSMARVGHQQQCASRVFGRLLLEICRALSEQQLVNYSLSIPLVTAIS